MRHLRAVYQFSCAEGEQQCLRQLRKNKLCFSLSELRFDNTDSEKSFTLAGKQEGREINIWNIKWSVRNGKKQVISPQTFRNVLADKIVNSISISTSSALRVMGVDASHPPQLWLGNSRVIWMDKSGPHGRKKFSLQSFIFHFHSHLRPRFDSLACLCIVGGSQSFLHRPHTDTAGGRSTQKEQSPNL